MLVRDMNSGRLVLLPDRASASLGYNEERLGLPILAALPALAAKAVPIITAVLPMLTKRKSSPPAAVSTPPAQLPAPIATAPPQSMPMPAPTAEPMPMPTMQTIGPSPTVDPTSATPPPAVTPPPTATPLTATTRTTDVDTEVVVAPVRVRQPNGQIAVVPMRVRRRRRQRRVRTMRVAPPPPLLMRPMRVAPPLLMRPMPVPLARYPIYSSYPMFQRSTFP